MGKGRVINCRSHLNTIRILTRLKNEGAKKKWGREGRKKKEKGWNNREKEREKKWGNEEEGWVSEERNLAKSRELIIENFRSPLLIPLQILFAPRGSAEDERVHYSPPPLHLALAHNRAEEAARVTRKTFKPESFQSASCCCPPFPRSFPIKHLVERKV